jgi:hypothetical protein
VSISCLIGQTAGKMGRGVRVAWPVPSWAHGGDGTVAQRIQRWTEVTPSQFTHETEGLNLVRSFLPANAPFRA